jgi:hypothetical protein
MAQWTAWNVKVLKLFGPVLILTGALGFGVPERLSLMSGAFGYNVFHLCFGVLGTGLAFLGPPRGAVLFNLGFGLVDLYQAGASALGTFPSELFRYRLADDVAHVLIGALLVTLGLAGLADTTRAAKPAR